MVGVTAYQRNRCPAVLIQPQYEFDDAGDHPLGQLADNVHGAGGGVLLNITFGQKDLLYDLFVVAF